MAAKSKPSDASTAKLLLIVLSVSWGMTWPIMKLALLEIPPLSMRTAAAGIGAAVLFAIAGMTGRSLFIARGRARLHIAVSGALNIVGFSLFTAFAQLTAATSRVTILAYTMPIWAALLARFVLGERFTVNRFISLALCVSGLAVLVLPQAEHGIPGGLLLAIGAGMSWAGGTIYQKWSRVEGDPVGVAAWQVAVGFLVMAVCLLIFEGTPHLWPVSWVALFGVFFTGAVGSGVAYLIWFEVVRRLPAMTASLGVLSSPVVGVLASVAILGERPTITDVIGFLLIFAASACVLIPSRTVVPAS